MFQHTNENRMFPQTEPYNVTALNHSLCGAKIPSGMNEYAPLSVAQGNECCGGTANANMQLYEVQR